MTEVGFSDIGIINFDLTEYGDLSGKKELSLFAKSSESTIEKKPEFSELKVWNNYKSFD